MRFYTSPEASAAKLPFSQAVQVGDVLYLSGALGNKPGTREVVPGGIAAETKQTMDNIGAVLAANGLGGIHRAQVQRGMRANRQRHACGHRGGDRNGAAREMELSKFHHGQSWSLSSLLIPKIIFDDAHD